MKKALIKVLIAFMLIVNVVSITGAKSTSHTYNLGNGLGELGLSINWIDNSGEYQGYSSYVKRQADSVKLIVKVPTAHTYSLEFYTRTVFYDSYIGQDTESRGTVAWYTSGGSSRKAR